MPNKTTNLGMNVFLENEVFDVDLVNENFQIIDDIPMTAKSAGVMTSVFSGAQSGTVTWRYKRYSDKTIDLEASIVLNSVYINANNAVPYYSNDVVVNLPVVLSSVNNIHTDIVANTRRWVAMTSSTGTVTTALTFSILSNVKDTSSSNRNTVFIQIKGVEP